MKPSLLATITIVAIKEKDRNQEPTFSDHPATPQKRSQQSKTGITDKATKQSLSFYKDRKPKQKYSSKEKTTTSKTTDSKFNHSSAAYLSTTNKANK